MTSEEFRNNPMFLRNQFETDGVFEMPKIRKDEISLENIALVGYDKLSDNKTDRIVHFFLDDYKFEVMWNDPEPRIERLKKFKAVLAPNYSLYTEMPLSLKIYNTFKSRWCGAYLQSKGIKVIPTVAWGEPDTFWFCFDGIAKGSTVAVSTLGVRTEKNLFLQGYNEMLRKIRPEAIIYYGEPFDEMKGNIIVIDYAETNNLNSKSLNDGTYIKKTTGYAFPCSEKGMGSAGNSNIKIPFPGWDITIPPGKDFEWRGSGAPSTGKGSWYNPKTKESLHPDLEHPEPYGPHWDYKTPDGGGYRIFPDGKISEKIFDMEGLMSYVI